MIGTFFACFACDTSGTDDGAEPISIAVAMLEHQSDGSLREVRTFEGLQAPINLITRESSAIHHLTAAMVAQKCFDLGVLDALLTASEVIFSWHPGFDQRMLQRVYRPPLPLRWHRLHLPDNSLPTPHEAGSGKTRAQERVSFMVAFLCSPPPVGSPPRLDWLLAQPADIASTRLPNYELEGNAVFERIFQRNLGESRPGDRFTLWTKEEMDFIVAYNRTRGGPGEIFHLRKSKNRKLAHHMATGHWVEGRVVSFEQMRCVVEVTVPWKSRKKRVLPETP